VFRIWDILFCEGGRTLFAAALAIFRAAAPELLPLRDPGLIGYAKHARSSAPGPQQAPLTRQAAGAGPALRQHQSAARVPVPVHMPADHRSTPWGMPPCVAPTSANDHARPRRSLRWRHSCCWTN